MLLLRELRIVGSKCSIAKTRSSRRQLKTLPILEMVMKDGPIKGVEYKKGNIIALNTHDKSFEYFFVIIQEIE